ncbi:DinB family protein [Paenibacillus filicis]|uniref:DinB family protein n=1 Tax=Paenibacillus gyeongsangnamensis TaxID=3388067 RepID=A0ABT4Q2D3_9BACL|nr:DinB family protein [Paenibacillus filicis]MCZ8511035.1 DinB family protein [Paenibacillus filicis]
MNIRPTSGEYGGDFGKYINRVPDGNIFEILTRQLSENTEFLSGLTETQAGHRYAPGKWSLKEVIGHVIDNERIMAYRLLRIARGDRTPLPGYDENALMEGSSFDELPWSAVLEDYAAVRRATLTLLEGLREDAWSRLGVANNAELSAKALAYIIAGHEIHHLGVIRERYLD